MAAATGRQGYRYGELIVDSFFSRDETATKVINTISNRPVNKVDALSVHQAKIPLTYDTIFSPYNEFTLDSFTYAGGESNAEVFYQSVNGKTATYSDGTPSSLTAQSFFGQTVNTTNQTATDTNTFRLRSPYGMVGAGIQVVDNTDPNAGNWSGYNCYHMAVCTLGINDDGTGFNLYVVVQSTTGVTTTDFTGTLTFSYSAYLGRKLGLRDNGTWTVDLADYTPTTTTGATDADSAPYVYTEAGTWNSGGNPSWAYYEIPFTFNFEMNMGRYLVLRGNLSSDAQSSIWLNNEDAMNSDVVAVLPVNGSYGDIMLYDTPNYEYFQLARTIDVRSLSLWFTRAEDDQDIPIEFKGVDYWLKLALILKEEFTSVPQMDNAGVWSNTNVRLSKIV